VFHLQHLSLPPSILPAQRCPGKGKLWQAKKRGKNPRNIDTRKWVGSGEIPFKYEGVFLCIHEKSSRLETTNLPTGETISEAALEGA